MRSDTETRRNKPSLREMKKLLDVQFAPVINGLRPRAWDREYFEWSDEGASRELADPDWAAQSSWRARDRIAQQPAAEIPHKLPPL